MSESEKRLLKSLKMCMRDFSLHTGKLKGRTSVYGLVNVSAGEAAMPLPYMVFLTLVALLGFKYHGREEKVAWSIPLTYKGTPFMISHQKFGLRIAAVDAAEGVTETAKEMLRQLRRGIRIADRLLRPIVDQLVRTGDTSIVNKSSMLYDCYLFFRKNAKQAFARSEPPPTRGGFDEAIRSVNRALKWERRGFFYTRAMMDAFYSWLEHVLVLLLPFCNYDRSTDDVLKLMAADWTTKFNRILIPDKDRVAKRLYNRLWEVKEKYRNTLAHGFFDKTGASVLAHMPVVGAVPISLSSYQDSIHYSFGAPVTKDTFLSICAVFDETESLLRRDKFRLPFAIIDSGLDIFLHDDGLARYAEATRSPKDTKDFVEATSRAADDAMNMDW